MEKHLNSFFQKQQEREYFTTEKFDSIDAKIGKAYILPKSLGMILGSFLILLIILMGYLTIASIETKREKIGNNQTEKYDGYFLEHPELKADFDNWQQNKDKAN